MRGTIRERQPGVWEVRVYVGRDPVTNSPRQISRTVRGGKRAAQAKSAELVAEAKRGQLVGTNATVATLTTAYLEALERKGLSPKTLHTYESYVRNHVEPALGAIPVRKLTAWDLDRLYTTMAENRSPATVRQTHAIIAGALGQAVKWGWCATNVARMASPPTVRVPRIVPPTVDEVRQLVEAAGRRNPILAALVMLAALTGARRGELCALRWTDVDLDAATVRISRSILDLPNRALEEKSTKTHQERTLALGDAGGALLQLHRQEVLERAQIGEVMVEPGAFIFSERLDCATPIRPGNVSGFFGAVRDELGLPHIHLHSLRHFMATQLAARGDVSARTLAGRLGHADASVSLRVYSAFFPPADVEAAEHLGRALAPMRGEMSLGSDTLMP